MPQLLGFSDVVTATTGVCAAVGAAIGFLMGGGVGDYLAMKFPSYARPAVNQVSILLTGPLYIIFLKALPGARLLCRPCCRCAHTLSASCIPWHACNAIWHCSLCSPVPAARLPT